MTAATTPLRRLAPLARLARLAFATLTLAAIGQQLVLHVGAGFNVVNFFSYFTNLSNLFAAGVLLLGVVASAASSGGDTARYLSAVYMAVVGLVFAVLLRNVDLGALLPWVNTVLHGVMPVVVVLDWWLHPPQVPLKARHLAVALVFPAAYLAYVVLRGASVGWYPYPFLNPAQVGGYGGVAAYAVGVAATFLLAAWAFWRIGNRRATGARGGAELG